ncbi:MAG TPA: lysophospholipid acyltransferase family protein [Phycisphaerae bacterium]|nr:lysophospholipid acyltransferase family protein [Phycisphaerae bacterium]HPS52620.1 lysophospholipid acyltransferase family protein [Phycisphaerae bacterium]
MKRYNHLNPVFNVFGGLPPKVEGAGFYYRFMRRVAQVMFGMLWKTRYFNRHFEPAAGSVIYMCNHQSFFDPMLASCALVRPGNYMARESLFKHFGFGNFIRTLNAFPVKRGTADVGALKEAMRRLKDGKTVVIFPEGTRTKNGCIGEFLPGVAMLAQRSADWVVPVVIDGAYEVWPRNQALPNFTCSIAVEYGQPISHEEAKKMAPQVFVNSVREKMILMQNELRTRIGRKPFDYSSTLQ